MLTIGYPPTQVGGTEVYVAGLVEALARRQHVAEVAYVEEIPSGEDVSVRTEVRNGTRVHQILVPRTRYRMESVVFDAELQAAIIDAFRTLVRQRQPDVIHVHPLQLGLEGFLLEALRNDGRKLVLTFHSSTTCCARGDLVRFGQQPCDGVIRQVECTECFMHFRGIPRPASMLLARLPLSWYRALHKSRRLTAGKMKSFSSLPLLVEARQHSWNRVVAACDRIVAVCKWVEQQCLANGARADKLVLSRHGHRFEAQPSFVRTSSVVRYGYLGRLSPEKGIGVLLDAVKLAGPDVPFEIEVASATLESARPSRDEQHVIDQLRTAARSDSRLKILGAIPDHELTARVATWDALVVPSLWFESGPQVIYEAFAAGTPVIGSRRGGIAELVTEAETGFLFDAGDSLALAGLLKRFARNPVPLRVLRAKIPPVRTTAAVAEDMIRVYETVMEPHVAVG